MHGDSIPPVLQFYDVSYLDSAFSRHLANINLSFEPSKVYILFGPEGCGSDLLVKLATGLKVPDRGSVLFQGKPLPLEPEEALEKARAKMGYVSGSFSLVNNMSVFDNIALPLRYHTRLRGNQISGAIEPFLKRYDLMHKKDVRPQLLGTSESLRVAYIRAVIYRPKMIILHSSMDGICPLARAKIFDLIKEDSVEYGFSVAMITYYPMQFYDPDHNFIMFYDGNIVFTGTGEDMMKNPNDFVNQYLYEQKNGPMASFHSQVQIHSNQV